MIPPWWWRIRQWLIGRGSRRDVFVDRRLVEDPAPGWGGPIMPRAYAHSGSPNRLPRSRRAGLLPSSLVQACCRRCAITTTVPETCWPTYPGLQSLNTQPDFETGKAHAGALRRACGDRELIDMGRISFDRQRCRLICEREERAPVCASDRRLENTLSGRFRHDSSDFRRRSVQSGARAAERSVTVRPMIEQFSADGTFQTDDGVAADFSTRRVPSARKLQRS